LTDERGSAVAGRVRRALSFGFDRFGRQLAAVGRACHGVATALSSASELARRRGALWDDWGVSAGHIEQGLFAWERSFYQRLAPRSRVLLVGCGSGRDLLGLLALGHEVVGIDPAPRPTAIARQQLIAHDYLPRVLTASLEEALLDERYDAVIFSWFTYSLIQGRQARVRALARAGALLAAGGRVLLSLPGGSPSASRLVPLMRLVARLSGADWSAEPGDSFEWEGGQVTWFHHRFAAGELEDEARQAGLRVVERREDDGVTLVELVPAAR
jgi:SAM-dependent methyltransferase